MIRAIEERSLNALPALESYVLDGWILRFSGGYTRRANSVNPLYDGGGDPDARISACEALYRARNLPVTFKLTAASNPPELEARLEARGYSREAETLVETCDLKQPFTVEPQVEIQPQITPEWFFAYSSMNNLPAAHLPKMQEMLSHIVPQVAPALWSCEGKPLACGLGVLDRGMLGLFDIVVAPEQRRKGYGKRLVNTLLAWGQARGAELSYLQVFSSNEPALELYARLGFREHHRYWYRVLV